MKVEVRPHMVRCVATKQELDGGVYRIFIDGKSEGFIGYRDGARPLLERRWNPLQLREIEKQIRIQLMPQKIGSCVMAPKPVKEVRRKTTTLQKDFA